MDVPIVIKTTIASMFYCLEDDTFFQNIVVPGDGSCLFHSLSYYMFGDCSHSLQLRQECCEMIRSDREDLAASLACSVSELDNYVEQMSNPKVYGSHLEMALLIRKYKISIWICSPVSVRVVKVILKEDNMNSTSIIRLLYVNGNHYMPLVEVDLQSMSVHDLQLHTTDILNSLVIEESIDDQTLLTPALPNVPADDQVMDIHGIENIGIDETMDVDGNDTTGRIGRVRYEDSTVENYLGLFKSHSCTFCGAYYFDCERTIVDKSFTKCCMRGNNYFETPLDVPHLIRNLLENIDPDSCHFRHNIRQYNTALAFASFGASVSAGNVPGRGPFVFRVQGVIYHLSANLQVRNCDRKYAQLYFIDSDQANQCRRNRNPELSQSLLIRLDNLMRKENVYAKEFFNLREKEEQEIRRCLGSPQNPVLYSVWLLKTPYHDKNRYNLPTTSEVAAVFPSVDGCPPYLRDIEIHNRNGDRMKLSIISQHTDPMTYPIFYPFGRGGWYPDMTGRSGKKITMAMYYSFLLSVREKFATFLHGGKLTQQFVDDAYCKMEASRVEYLRNNQKTLRADYYKGLHDYLRGRSEKDNCKIGKAVILPSSFPGSPRHMAQNYQDAMAIVSKYGKPDVFITFTCNPKWKEIVENLERYETPSDRPDLVSRVFFQKFSALLHELTDLHVLGELVAFCYVFEWQKRGLPHAHILGMFGALDKIRTPEDIDTVVSAEIPDVLTQPKLFKVIESSMIHGPCGDRNKNSPCMTNGVCTKNYPKAFSDVTIFNENGFPRYRRRNDGRCINIHRSNGTPLPVDNRDVVPYNPYLSARFNAHINVEVCSTVKSVKYLFKYIYKGHSSICMAVNLDEQPVYNHDEITDYLNARYVGPCEAFHRIYGYILHDSSHCIYRLAVHLEDMQPVYFNVGEEEEALMKNAVTQTTLTEWFRMNKTNCAARKYLYSEMPQFYVWNKVKRVWTERKRMPKLVLGRMYNVSVREGERFYLRLLLLHRRGCTSFADLRTIDGTEYDTFRAAARAMNLLNDDSTWYNTMMEAVGYQMPCQLRELFATICMFCEPSDPRSLWTTFIDDLTEDYIRAGNSAVLASEKCLLDINNWFSAHGKNNANFDLPLPNQEIIQHAANSLVDGMIEHYDPIQERENGLTKMNLSNPEQLLIIKNMMHVLYPDDIEWAVDKKHSAVTCGKNVFLINAAAGTGKTWIYNILIHLIRSKGDTVIPLAFTGIAASLLMGGRTLHSGLKLPLSLDETSTCGITSRQAYAGLIKKAKLIIIDEISMCSRLALDAVNRFLRELMNIDVPYGKKCILLGGDFMQTLPVIRHGSRNEIIHNMVKFSRDWENVHTFYLHKNMRVRPGASSYADWILKIGKGTLSEEEGLQDDLIKIPSQCLISSSELICAIFGSHLCPSDVDDYKEKAILTPLNEDTFIINEEVLEIVQGESKIYYSDDSIAEDENSGNFTEVSSEFLHSITPGGMPPHKLVLKCGAIIMLLRNLNTRKGLCNGTRLVITGMQPNVLKAKILTGTEAGSLVLIPRILLYSGKEELPFDLKRTQFPIRLAFCITINKAQGQSYEKTGLYLPQPVFTHGQLYVAFSRARCYDDIKVAINKYFYSTQSRTTAHEHVTKYTRNVVFREILID